MQSETTIRAVDYEPQLKEDASMPLDDMGDISVTAHIFGEGPDYTNPAYEELWQQVFNADDDEMIAYCLSKGVDVLNERKEPVTGWRDIAVMLKAIDTGLVKVKEK